METELLLRGFTEDKCVILSQKNAFTNPTIFDIWAAEIFFPSTQQTRADLQYER
jgi:hypothetical protein